MLEAVIFMMVALMSTVALWRILAPTLADRQSAQPIRIRRDEDIVRRNRE